MIITNIHHHQRTLIEIPKWFSSYIFLHMEYFVLENEILSKKLQKIHHKITY